MPLIVEDTNPAFDTQLFTKGDFIRARYHTWPESRNGLITAVSKEKLTVLYLPGIGNVSNYFPILADEVAADKWQLTWSLDLETIERHGDVP